MTETSKRQLLDLLQKKIDEAIEANAELMAHKRECLTITEYTQIKQTDGYIDGLRMARTLIEGFKEWKNKRGKENGSGND